jgi:excisionase family DNA binding protein
MPILIGTMKAYTTPEVAEMVGIHLRTLHRWLDRGAIPEPSRGKIGGLTVRIWTERNIEIVRNYKTKTYCKGRGRKPGHER